MEGDDIELGDIQGVDAATTATATTAPTSECVVGCGPPPGDDDELNDSTYSRTTDSGDDTLNESLRAPNDDDHQQQHQAHQIIHDELSNYEGSDSEAGESGLNAFFHALQEQTSGRHSENEDTSEENDSNNESSSFGGSLEAIDIEEDRRTQVLDFITGTRLNQTLSLRDRSALSVAEGVVLHEIQQAEDPAYARRSEEDDEEARPSTGQPGIHHVAFPLPQDATSIYRRQPNRDRNDTAETVMDAQVRRVGPQEQTLLEENKSNVRRIAIFVCLITLIVIVVVTVVIVVGNLGSKRDDEESPMTSGTAVPSAAPMTETPTVDPEKELHEVEKLTGRPGDLFGSAVAILDNTLVVGAPGGRPGYFSIYDLQNVREPVAIINGDSHGDYIYIGKHIQLLGGTSGAILAVAGIRAVRLYKQGQDEISWTSLHKDINSSLLLSLLDMDWNSWAIEGVSMSIRGEDQSIVLVVTICESGLCRVVPLESSGPLDETETSWKLRGLETFLYQDSSHVKARVASEGRVMVICTEGTSDPDEQFMLLSYDETLTAWTRNQFKLPSSCLSLGIVSIDNAVSKGASAVVLSDESIYTFDVEVAVDGGLRVPRLNYLTWEQFTSVDVAVSASGERAIVGGILGIGTVGFVTVLDIALSVELAQTQIPLFSGNQPNQPVITASSRNANTVVFAFPEAGSRRLGSLPNGMVRILKVRDKKIAA